jgi:hypothetical protein
MNKFKYSSHLTSLPVFSCRKVKFGPHEMLQGVRQQSTGKGVWMKCGKRKKKKKSFMMRKFKIFSQHFQHFKINTTNFMLPSNDGRLEKKQQVKSQVFD